MFREKQKMLAIVKECEKKYGKYNPITVRVRKMANTLTPTSTNVKVLENLTKRVDI